MGELQAGDPPRRGRSVRIAGLVEAAAWIALATSVAGFFGAEHRFLELCAHFRWQYLVAGAGALAVGGLAGVPRLAVVGLLLVAVNGGVLHASRGAPWRYDHVDGQPVRLVFANVHERNPDLGAFLAWVAAEKPDVVIVAELSPEHAAALQGLSAELPHGLTVPRGVFGIGVWSRHPLTRKSFHELREDWLCPVTDIEFDVNGRPLRVIGAHLFPPLGQRGDERNLDQLRGLAEYLGAGTGERVVVAGDFNVTPFAARWRELLKATGLRSASDGRWPWPTWRPQSPAAAPFALPIDHVLLRGGELAVADFAIGPDVGSDHRPVRVDLVTARKPM